jgi:hypothetical protein
MFDPLNMLTHSKARYSIITACFVVCGEFLPLTNKLTSVVMFQVMEEERVTCGLIMTYLAVDITERLGSAPRQLSLRWAITGGEVLTPKNIEVTSNNILDEQYIRDCNFHIHK